MNHVFSSLKGDASLNPQQTIKTLTMGPAGPLGPAGPSFPWGPWKYKMKTEKLDRCSSCLKNSENMVAIKTSLCELTLTPADPIGPAGPGGPGEPCKHTRKQLRARFTFFLSYWKGHLCSDRPVEPLCFCVSDTKSPFLCSFAQKLCSLFLLPILSGLWCLGIRFTGNIIYSRSVLLAIINQDPRGLQVIKCMLL